MSINRPNWTVLRLSVPHIIIEIGESIEKRFAKYMEQKSLKRWLYDTLLELLAQKVHGAAQKNRRASSNAIAVIVCVLLGSFLG